ncbi:MAG: molybdate ABC transporter permease subunit [Neptuniibacter sp.]
MLEAILLTLKLATVTTLVLLVLGIPLAWWLSQTRSWWSEVVATLVALPLVLPPTVLGFYLLILLSPNSSFGQLIDSTLGLRLPFTFAGLVIGSVVYSLPFVVQPIRNAFDAMGPRPIQVAATLRASPLDTFFTVILPLARSGILTGTILGFAYTVGEFGVVLMIGGNIPGETQVLSIAIYDYVETMNWEMAHILSLMMVVFSFVVILLMNLSEKRMKSRLT